MPPLFLLSADGGCGDAWVGWGCCLVSERCLSRSQPASAKAETEMTVRVWRLGRNRIFLVSRRAGMGKQ